MSGCPAEIKSVKYSAIAIAIGIILLYGIFCIYYSTHTRAALLADYFGMGNCFYNTERFATIFNEKVKTTGNLLCIIAVPVVVLFCYWGFRLSFVALYFKLKEYLKKQRDCYPWVVALLVFCLVSSWFGHRNNAMCTDEAFSALNFAEEPIGRLISYYPVPNNHIFFNLINHFAAKLGGNAFLSGRMLSVLCYCLLLTGNFFLFRYFTRNSVLSFLCCLLLSLQFLIWGFGHQARGYALCYLMEWVSFVAFYLYFFDRTHAGKEPLLLVLLCCNIAGMWAVPVFLYFFLFQAIAACCIIVGRKSFYPAFWKMMLMSTMGIFLVYLPLFCYSGISSVVGNSFVPDSSNGLAELWQSVCFHFYNVISIQTFNFMDTLKPLALVLFIIPFVLVCCGRLKQLSGLLFMYFMVWLSVIILIFYMNQFPVIRAIGAQMHFSLLMVLLPIAILIARMKKSRNYGIGLLLLFTVFCSVRMFRYNKKFSNTDLYGQDTKAFMNALKTAKLDFDPTVTIWLSDESFIWPFLLKDFKQVVSHKCNFNNQKVIFLSEDDQPLPDSVLNNYVLKEKVSWFSIYVHQ